MAHSLTRLLVHCVFGTKGRRGLLKGDLSEKVDAYMAGIARNHGAHLIRAGGTADHRHLLLAIKATINVADMMRLIKANSSKWLRESHPALDTFGWQTGYAAFSVSESAAARVVKYINDQEVHHQKMTFEEELVALLDRHRISYDRSRILD